MILDAQNMLSDSQAVTADAVSANTIDLANPTEKNEIGAGEPLTAVIAVEVAADFTTGDETYEFQLIQSANADLSSPDVLASRAIVAGSLTAGSIHYLPVPPGSVTKRYLGLNYNVGGTSPSITVSAFIQPQSMIENRKAYARGYNVS
jgi:hypothetical protein